MLCEFYLNLNSAVKKITGRSTYPPSKKSED